MPAYLILSVILVGIFFQSIAVTYRLYEKAICKHLEELNALAEEFLKELNATAGKSTVEFSRFLYIEFNLCNHYGNITSKCEMLVEDIGNHWKKG